MSVTVTLRTVIDQSGIVAELRLMDWRFQVNGFSAALSAGQSTLKQLERFAKAQFSRRAGERSRERRVDLPAVASLHRFSDGRRAAVALRGAEGRADRVRHGRAIHDRSASDDSHDGILPVALPVGCQMARCASAGAVKPPVKLRGRQAGLSAGGARQSRPGRGHHRGAHRRRRSGERRAGPALDSHAR